MSDSTRLLSLINSSAPLDSDELLELLYDELRQLAVSKMADPASSLERPVRFLGGCGSGTGDGDVAGPLLRTRRWREP